MSNLERLMALHGADVVGGALIWRHKELGRFRNGDFFISEDGKDALNIVEVDSAPAVETKEAAPRTRKIRVAPAAEVADVEVKAAPEPTVDLGNLELDA